MATNARKLFVLANNVWNADDYLKDRCCDPVHTDLYLYATIEEAREKAKTVDTDNETWNDGTIYEGELTDNEILELTGFESIDDFNEALAEPYSTEARVKNFGEDEKGEVAQTIIEDSTNEYPVECANYDFDKSLDGCVLVFWRWERYIGYARKLIDVRRAYDDDTEALLTKQDRVGVTQCDVLLTKQEADDADDLQEAIREKLESDSWKWQNEDAIYSMIEEF